MTYTIEIDPKVSGTNRPLADMLVKSFTDSATKPAALVTVVDHNLPVDKQKFADNLQAILNDSPVPHQIDMGDKEVFYQRTDSAINVRVRDPNLGISQPALIIVPTSDSKEEVLGKLDNDAMASLCGSMQTPTGPFPMPSAPAPGGSSKAA